MIPKIIHFTLPRNASAAQLANIETARQVHPDWEVKVWQDPVDPAGFRLAKFWGKANSATQLADLVRLEVVQRDGGFFVDADITLHKRLDELGCYQFVVGSVDGNTLSNAFFGSAPGGEVLEHLITQLADHEVDWSVPASQSTGTGFFAQELKWRNDVTVVPRETLGLSSGNQQPGAAHPWAYGVVGGDAARGAGFSLRAGRQWIGKWFVERAKWLELQHARLSRQLRPWPYQAAGVICVQTLHGYKLFLQGEDTSITPHVAHAGCYEFEEEQLIKHVVQSGDWVIDVGANVGALSMLFAHRVGSFGRVFSFEPNPLCAALLKKSLVVNWMHERVRLHEKGVGSMPARMVLRYGRTRLGDASLVNLEEVGSFKPTLDMLGDAAQIEVEVTTLDAEFPVNLPIRLLKVDVEGFEHQVLAGAARLLDNRCIDLLMLECSREIYGANWPAFEVELKRLVERGYSPAMVNRRGQLKKIGMQQVLYDNVGRNVLFVSPHAQRTLL
jgi:FkbM family methyltransferase